MTASECPHKGNSPVCPKCRRMVPDSCGLQALEKAQEAPKNSLTTSMTEEPAEQPEEPLRRRGRPPKVQP